MNSPILVLGIFVIFVLKFFLKFFQLDPYALFTIIIFFKVMENYIRDTSFGKRLKGIEEKIFNLWGFQAFVFLCLMLETLFFQSKEIGLKIFDRAKIFLVRTMWLVLVWKGFFVIYSEPMQTFFDVVSVFVFFCTILYMDLRSKLVNYQFLGLDTSFVTWSHIVLKIQILGNYHIASEIKDDFKFHLLSFSKHLNVSKDELKSTKSLSSPRRTMVTETINKGINYVGGLENAMKIVNTLLASGAVGNAYMNYQKGHKEVTDNIKALLQEVKPLQSNIDQFSKEALQLSLKIKELEAPLPQNLFSRLFYPFFGEAPNYKVLREIELYKFDLHILNKRIVKSFVELDSINAALTYGKKVRAFPFFVTPLDERVYTVTNAINTETLVDLFERDQQKFFVVINLINQKIITEGCTIEHLRSDSFFKPFLKLAASVSLEESVSTMVTCSSEDSFTTFSFIITVFNAVF